MFNTLSYSNGRFFILDQTLLPKSCDTIEIRNIFEGFKAIKELKVRGAPAIGVAGSYILLIALKPLLNLTRDEFIKKVIDSATYINSSRPTAVNLSWGLNRMKDIATNSKKETPNEIFKELEIEAIKIHNEDIAICSNIGLHGSALIKNGYGVLTHCNAGALATSGIGTALAPMYIAQNNGVKFKVYSDETRPLLQGLRLTAWELHKSNIDVTTICDNMAAYTMSKGLINLCIVGCDRVAKNGDTANKIGTLGVAILAKHYNIPFYIAMPSSTFDKDTLTGPDIVIEERNSDEIGAAPGVKVLNPAFDVTPHELITGFITENGIFNDTSEF